MVAGDTGPFQRLLADPDAEPATSMARTPGEGVEVAEMAMPTLEGAAEEAPAHLPRKKRKGDNGVACEVAESPCKTLIDVLLPSLPDKRFSCTPMLTQAA